MANSTNTTEDPKVFYGYLFKPDKGPTETMRELLTGIARYIIKSIGDPEIRKLTPAKLAEFYKAVGGNYDPVFLEPPHDRISFIYTSLGCQHTLQPGDNDYEPPKIPALTLKGFVRWQSIEMLLGPEEHVPYLQHAVQHFEIMRFDGTTRFPPTLPKECLPTKADEDVVGWHEDCSKKLWKEYITPVPTPKGSPRPRSYTGPPAGTPMDNMQYKYAYAHVKVPPGHSWSAASSPRQRPTKEREDYFNSKPAPSARMSKPSTADGRSKGHNLSGQRRSSPEEYEDIWYRGRRRSVPKNYYNNAHDGLDGSDLPTPGRATSHPASPRETRPHSGSFGASAKEHYVRRHSHPRHKHVEEESSSSDEEGEADDIPPGPPSPQYSKMRGAKSNVDMGASAHRLSRESVRGGGGSKTNVPDLRYEAASPVGTPSRGAGQRFSPQVSSGFGSVASSFGHAHARAYSGLDVPQVGSKARVYKVHSADEKGELKHKHSTSTSGGSRSNSRGEERSGKRSGGGVRWVKELVGDALPFTHRRHSDSPPARDRDDVRRDEGQKYRKEDVGGMGRKDRSSEEDRSKRLSDEERRKARRKEEALWRERERERDGGRRVRPEVERRY